MTTTDSSGYGATSSVGSTSDASKSDVAKEQAGQVAGSAKEQAGQVASTAKEQASQVAGTATEKAGQVAQTTKEQAQEVVAEATSQARNLVGELKTQVGEQAGTQRDRLVGQLRGISDELTQLAEGGGTQPGGIAGDVLGQVNSRVQDVVSYLDGKEPADLLTAVQSYARRKPGTFLAGAAVAGLLAGRLTRGAREAASDDSDQMATTGYTPTYAASVPPSTYATDIPATTYVPEIPSSTYPTTVSSAGGFSTTTPYDEPTTGYASGSVVDETVTTYDDAYGTDTDRGQRL